MAARSITREFKQEEHLLLGTEKHNLYILCVNIISLKLFKSKYAYIDICTTVNTYREMLKNTTKLVLRNKAACGRDFPLYG